MARKPKNGGDDQSEQSEQSEQSSEELVIISRSKLRALISELASHQAEMDEIRGTMGGTVNAAVKDHNVHKGALAIVRRLRKADPQKRAEFLFHFDRYRKHMGWDAQADLFREDEGGVEVEAGQAQEAPAEPTGEPETLHEGVTPFRRPIAPETAQEAAKAG